MTLNTIVYILLLVSGSFAISNVILVWGKEKSSVVTYGISAMGFSAALWCYGMGLTGFCTNLEAVYIIRKFTIAGVNLFFLSECISLAFASKMSRKQFFIMMIPLTLFSLFDFIVYSKPENHIYTIQNGIVSFVNPATFANKIHQIYVLFISSFMTIHAVFVIRKQSTRRQKRFLLFSMLSSLAIVIFAIPDTILPYFGVNSVMTSGIGAVISFCYISFKAKKHNAFNITVENLSKYVYEIESVAILAFDENERLVLANQYARNFLKIDGKKDFLISDLFNVEPEEFDNLFSEKSQRVWKSKKDNISCQLTPSVVRDHYGDPYCYLCVVFDITYEEQMMNAVISANHAKSDFLANMSHEIRTPINAVLGMNEMIMRESENPTVLSYAQNIDGAGKTLLTLINDILDFSKIESGRLEITPNDYDLLSVVNDVYNMLNVRAQEKNLELRLELDENLPEVFSGDELRVRQIITNLLTNAVKYTEKGWVSVSIKGYPLSDEEKTSDKNQIMMEIQVIDTGIGIKEENLPKIFSVFKRVDAEKTKSIEGTGLGLSITRKLIELMGGKITVESEYGKGSVFTAKFPQIVVKDTPIGKVDLLYKEKRIEKNNYEELFHAPQAKILVVDDIEMNLKVFVALLKKTLVQVECVQRGAVALEKMCLQQYDMIFLDHMMPEMDGVEVLKAFKNAGSACNASTPIIMLTANAILGADAEYLQMGFTDYLSKPIQGKALERMIIKYLPEEKVELKEDDENDKPDNIPAENVSPVQDELFAYRTFLDVDAALKFCADDKDLFKELVQIYLEDSKLDAIRDFYNKEDWKNYEILVHALKSSSKNVGAIKLSEASKSLETAAKQNDFEFIKNHHEETMMMYETLLNNIKNA